MTTQAQATPPQVDEDQYFLQPMLQKLPPKELISQKYSPDIIPQVKLITQKDKKSCNTNFIPPKIKNAQLVNYAANFNILDYLGNSYSGIINQVVYMKFNNSKYNVVPEAKHKTRIMPAFYVPFQQIYSEFQSTFTKNIGFSFPETHHNATIQAEKCNKGCSFDPIFSSNYQTANLFAAIRTNAFEYDLILQNDINSCRSVGWFNFSVQFLQQGYYTFKIKNITTDMSKLFKKGMKISYCQLNSSQPKPFKKAGEEWNLCGDNITFGKGETSNELHYGEKYYQLSFQYRCRNKHDIVMFAFDCPYSLFQGQRFYQTVMFKKVRGMTQFQRIEYGKTVSGSPLSAYLIKKKKNRGDSIQATFQSERSSNIKERRSINLSPINKNSAEIKKKSVIIIGRLGASDVGSSYIIEGMMDYLVDNLEYDTLKKTIDFYFFPFCNVDGAKYGNDLTNLTGINLNGDWRQVNKSYNGQIFYLKQFLNKINKQNPISLILSLVPQHQQLFSSVLGFKTQNEDCQDSRIFPFVLSKRNRMLSFENSVFLEKFKNNSMCCVLGETFSNSLIYQFKISHFQRTKINEEKNEGVIKIQDEDLKQRTPDSYRGLGKEIISNYLQHVILYDKNILLRDKWLKQILQIEQTLQKKSITFYNDEPIEKRFRKSFYQIQFLKEIPSLFQLKSCNSINAAKPKKKSVDLNNRLDNFTLLIKEKTSIKRLPCAFNDISKQKQLNDTIMQTKKQIIDNPKQQISNSQTLIDKQISLFRIASKPNKTSILKNCIPNFQIQSENNDLLKMGKKQRISKINKEELQKEITSKYLKRVKVQETLKRRASKQKLGYIIKNI